MDKPILSEADAARLVAEPKRIKRQQWLKFVSTKPSTGTHASASVDVKGKGHGGHRFRLIVRHCMPYPDNFCVTLIYIDASGVEYRLRRYDRHPAEHANNLEGTVVLGSQAHIHVLTERYQKCGKSEDAYAEATDRFQTRVEALEAMLVDTRITRSGIADEQRSWLFREHVQ